MLRKAPSRNADASPNSGSYFFSGLRAHDVFGAETHVHVADHRLEQLVVDVALTQRRRGPSASGRRRHDARVGLRRDRRAARPRGHGRRTRRRCDSRAAATLPRKRRRRRRARSAPELHEEVAVRVRGRQVAVVDASAPQTRAIRRARVVLVGRATSGSGSTAGLRTRPKYTRLLRYMRRLLVRDDRAARAADELVRADCSGCQCVLISVLDSIVAGRGEHRAQ